MNKTKLYCHLGGISCVIAFLAMVSIGIFVPTKYLLWLVSIAAIVAFLGAIYFAGYHYVWEKIDGIRHW